jgi:hypothetical protein
MNDRELRAGDDRLIYETRIWKILFFPKRSFFQLQKAETIYGLSLRAALLILSSILIFAASGLAGIGSHVFSFELLDLPASLYEWRKSYFIFGRFLLGLLYAGLIIFFSAFVLWTLTDVPYKKLVVLQTAVMPILLIEQAFHILLAIQFHLPWHSSPFSLGPIAQYLTNSPFIIYFLGCISFFKIWVIIIQIYGLSSLSRQKKLLIWILVLAVHLLFWAGTAFLAFLDFNVVL